MSRPNRSPHGTPPFPRLLVSDVDGTLLDDRGRFVTAPRVLRETLHAALPGALFALASSRTLDELLLVQRALGVTGPIIAEDGAVLALDAVTGPAHDIAHDTTHDTPPAHRSRTAGRRTLHVSLLGPDAEHLHREWTRIVSTLRAPGIRTAAMLTPAELAARGITSPRARVRALDQRLASVLIDLAGIDIGTWHTLVHAVTHAGLDIARGGRWATLTGRTSKGRALRHLRERLPMAPVHVIAIGNDENDRSLLEAADQAFVIRNPGIGPHPGLARITGAELLDTEGPAGWLEMLARLTEHTRAT